MNAKNYSNLEFKITEVKQLCLSYKAMSTVTMIPLYRCCNVKENDSRTLINSTVVQRRQKFSLIQFCPFGISCLLTIFSVGYTITVHGLPDSSKKCMVLLVKRFPTHTLII